MLFRQQQSLVLAVSQSYSLVLSFNSLLKEISFSALKQYALLFSRKGTLADLCRFLCRLYCLYLVSCKINNIAAYGV
ncbi:hypothetical protein V8C42DRAFT_337463 [Trichoderma barbatum]